MLTSVTTVVLLEVAANANVNADVYIVRLI